MPTSAPQPTEERIGALVKTSASGPMPTSRYCDQTPSSMSAAFTFAASGEPALRLRRLSPIMAVTRSRIFTANTGSPAALSSMTRSIIERANVTPQALITCKSHGARRLRLQSSTAPSLAPACPESHVSGSSSSNRSRMVATPFAVTSTKSPPRSVTSAGPFTSSRQTRPTNVPDSNKAGFSLIESRSGLVSPRQHVFPFQRGFDDKIKIIVLRMPAEFLLGAL